MNEPAQAENPAPEEPQAAPAEESSAELHLKAELAEAQDRYLRAIAEMQNLRRRTEKETQDARRFAVGAFAGEVLHVLENLYRAEDSVPSAELESNGFLKALFDGVALMRAELERIFQKHGITRLYPLGQAFDHKYHEAMLEIPDATRPPGTVVQVMQAGYTLHDRLLRPAMVGIAKAMEASPSEPPKDGMT